MVEPIFSIRNDIMLLIALASLRLFRLTSPDEIESKEMVEIVKEGILINMEASHMFN